MLRGGAVFLLRKARHFLRWGDTILGSLADAIPTAELLKQFKECVENDFEEQEDGADKQA